MYREWESYVRNLCKYTTKKEMGGNLRMGVQLEARF
jgi:hypothetical protein